jgi:fatty-acyl-CoA synthase
VTFEKFTGTRPVVPALAFDAARLAVWMRANVEESTGALNRNQIGSWSFTPMPDRNAFWPPYVPRNLTAPQTSIWYNLEVSSKRQPNKPAFICYGNEITFAALKAEADKLAGYLQKRCGVSKGDRVLLFAQNSFQFIVAYYAILRADAVVVPINPMNLTAELRRIVADCGAKVAFIAQELWPQAAPLTEDGMLAHSIVATYSDYLAKPTDLTVPDAFKLPRQPVAGKGVVAWGDAIAANLAPEEHTSSPDDLCCMPYTSGSTGEPKGCMHTHRSVMHTCVSGTEWFRTIPEVIYLGVLPFFHVTGVDAPGDPQVFDPGGSQEGDRARRWKLTAARRGIVTGRAAEI